MPERSSTPDVFLPFYRSPSAFMLAYKAIFNPGSFRCDECQNANGSDSLPIISPKSRASYSRGRITFWFKSFVLKTFMVTRAPSFSHVRSEEHTSELQSQLH